mmetsp:Transcript_662/g.1959  ORF Transcript_662/g.1959 Transcript_662/m.1959 type:complete len:147 (-) Transcript_662:9280-9720(-)
MSEGVVRVLDYMRGLIDGANPIVVMMTSMLALASLPVVMSWLMSSSSGKRMEDQGGEEKEQGEGTKEASHAGNLTKEELKGYTGKDESKPLLVAIRGKIYDVSPVSQPLPFGDFFLSSLAHTDRERETERANEQTNQASKSCPSTP